MLLVIFYFNYLLISLNLTWITFTNIITNYLMIIVIIIKKSIIIINKLIIILVLFDFLIDHFIEYQLFLN